MSTGDDISQTVNGSRAQDEMYTEDELREALALAHCRGWLEGGEEVEPYRGHPDPVDDDDRAAADKIIAEMKQKREGA